MARHFNKELARYWNIYVKCPTTGGTIEGMRGDDKVLCNCSAALAHGGTHVVALCEDSSVEAYMSERGYGEAEGGGK
jgi:translation initiation factor 2 beta subunit (eIF-2beta)/eIF-5